MITKSFLRAVMILALSGCATLPTNGPTRGEIEKSVKRAGPDLPIGLVQVTTFDDLPPAPVMVLPDMAQRENVVLPTDMVGAGDVLDVNIYEAGVTLFLGAGVGNASTIGAQSQRLPQIRVDDDGYISLPYAGSIYVAGRTVREVEAIVRSALKGMSQNPQVLITLGQSISNSIIIGGEVARPGRLTLQTNKESLSDVVALAGGYRGNTKDLLARVSGDGRIIDIRMNDLVDNPLLDVRILPGDRVTLINDPRTYSVLGASGQVAELPFNRSSVTLSEAIANAGGVNSNIGDPAAVFLFRFEKDDQGTYVPKIYHLNMMKAGTYFLAQRFVVRDKDVIYFGNAAANQPSKLLQLISQLFTPIVTATATVQAVR